MVFFFKQERGFFPLSAALLSSPVLRLASGPAAEILMEIASSIEALVLSLLFCRSGLIGIFLKLVFIIFIHCDMKSSFSVLRVIFPARSA